MQEVEQSEALRRAKEDGVDLTLLLENLKLTPTERIKKHQAFLAFLLEVRRAGERHRNAPQR